MKEALFTPKEEEAPKTPTAKGPSGETQTEGDAAIAQWEKAIMDSGIPLSPAEQAELDASKAALDSANLTAEGYAQAGECLTGAGI